jgi:hypothetical protein
VRGDGAAFVMRFHTCHEWTGMEVGLCLKVSFSDQSVGIE